MNNKKTCGIIGCQAKEFPWNYKRTFCAQHQKYLDSMAYYTKDCISKHDINYFICGADKGVNSDFAELAVGFRDKFNYDINLEIVIPFNDIHKYNIDAKRKPIPAILKQADKCKYVWNKFFSDSNIVRNDYIVDKSDMLLVFFNERKKNSIVLDAIDQIKILEKPFELFPLNDYCG